MARDPPYDIKVQCGAAIDTLVGHFYALPEPGKVQVSKAKPAAATTDATTDAAAGATAEPAGAAAAAQDGSAADDNYVAGN